MKRRVIKILILIGVGIIFFSVSCNTSTYFGRWMTWRASDIKDFEKFPSIKFEASSSPFRFIEVPDHSLDSLSVTVKENRKEFLHLTLKQSETTAFIVIRNDSLIYEKYLNGYSRESMNTSFSVGKSITSLMIGNAIDEGLIKSVNDPVTDYFPELLQRDQQYNKVTIAYLLNMKSGIQFKDHDLPWGDKPKAYYYPRLRERILELPIKFEPGGEFRYNSYNPILAGMILEKTTRQSPAKYFEEKIWNKLGMEFSGSWSVDSEESRMTKMESGLNLRAIDFAKLGRLVLNKGNWNGDQVISQEWMEECSAILPENKVPEFGDEIYYEKFWWLFSKDHQNTYIISGWGHLGQFLYIFPNEKVIIVRMGKDTGKVQSWKKVFQEVVDKIQEKEKPD
ncbi:MAG: beta-lactamase family protein [Cyclobacteriaceae bacterium]|nr:beta-lactamase family protein [Cyclobacteriaceae bacterium]